MSCIHALHEATARGEIIPVGCGSATANMGVSELLDALIEYVPSPAETNAGTNGNLSALVFKTIADPYVGKLTYFRVFSGALRNDSHVFNVTRGHDEHIGPVLVVARQATGEHGRRSARAISARSPSCMTPTPATRSRPKRSRSRSTASSFPSRRSRRRCWPRPKPIWTSSARR